MFSPSSSHQNPNDSPESHPPSQSCSPKEIAISPIRASSTPFPPIEIESLPSPVNKSSEDGDLPFQGCGDKENELDFEAVVELGEDAFYSSHHEKQKRFCSTPSPHRGHLAGNDGMRHHLLVQRTFNHHEVDCMGPLTSSPMRKVPIIVSPGGLTPSTSKYSHKESCSDGHYNNNTMGCTPQFKTPVRGQRDNHSDRAWERTPSAPRTPAGFMSPASSLYAFSTPGRQFVNPFEVDHERVHFPALTPSLFHVKQKDVESSAEKEGFWTVEQTALLMPVEIKESEILRQHFHQTKRAKEMDPLLQKAVDRFFSNELIVPSPWSDQKGVHSAGRLKQTPTGVKTPAVARSVSCQTSMSVPPDVDLVAELGDKYQLPDDQLVRESPIDSSLAGCFIRRKLLHQLNENDDSVMVGASPELPSRTQSLVENEATSASPSPTKQVTPEIDKQTPNKKSSGHFSSSPIRPAGDRGNHPAMSESDLLASPELSPIAGRGSNKPLRSSDMFTPRQEFERSREIMQLDFSSILDEPDDFDNANLSERTGTLIQTKEYNSLNLNAGASNSALLNNNHLEQQQRLINSPWTNSHDVGGICDNGEAGSSLSPHPNTDPNISSNNNRSINNTLRKSLLVSGLSAESSIHDFLPSNIPNLLTSQDTGYQTASLQSITNLDSASNPQSHLQDIHSSSALSSCSSANQSLMMSATNLTNDNAQSKVLPPSSSTSIDFSNFNPSSKASGDCAKDHNTLHMSFTNQYTGIMPSNHHNHKSDLCTGDEGNSLDSYLSSATRLSYLFSDNDNNDLDFYSNSFTKGHNNCRVRKIRTLGDVRRSREKSNASRDLTSSFNEEARSASTVIVRLSRSLSNPSINMNSASTSAAAESMIPTTVEVLSDNQGSSNARPEFSSKVKGDSGTLTDQRVDSSNASGRSSLRAVSSSLEKRPFENIGASAENERISVEVIEDDSDNLAHHNSNKFIKLLDDEHEKEFYFKDDKGGAPLFTTHSPDDLRTNFSLELENKNTLDEARELLGKSEALRLQHDCDGSKNQLERDTFYQYISEHDCLRQLPATGWSQQTSQGRKDTACLGEIKDTNLQLNGQSDKLPGMEEDVTRMSSMKSLHPVRMSTPEDAMFDSMEEKINSIEGVKLGSEIAAEILKRAGEDLAQFTTL